MSDPDTIETNSQNPKRVRGDEGEVEQHSISDQIMADRYEAAGDAVDNNTRRGLRISRFQPPGITDGPAD